MTGPPATEGARNGRGKGHPESHSELIGVHPHSGPMPRVRSRRHLYTRIEIVAVPLVAVLGLVLVGRHVRHDDDKLTLGDRVLDALHSFSGGIPTSEDNYSGWLLLGRFLVASVALYATLRLVMLLYWDRTRAWRVGKTRGHTIVAGLSEAGVRAVQSYAPRGRVVALTRTPLSQAADVAVARGADVVWGDPRFPGSLRSAGIKGARHLICADDAEDASFESALAALRLREAAGDRYGKLDVHVASATADVPDALAGLGLVPRWITISTFDLHDLWARRLVEAGPLWRYRSSAEPPPTIIVLGSGRLAGAFLLEAVRWWHFGARESEVQAPLPLHVVAPDAETVCEALGARYPAAAATTVLVPHVLDPLATTDLEGVPLPPTEAPWGAYVCLDVDDSYRLTVAGRYGTLIGDRHDGSVFVALSALSLDLRPAAHVGVAAGRPPVVGIRVDDEGGLDLERLGRTEALARTIHGVYERFQREQGRTATVALVPFDELSDDLRVSNRRQARQFDTQLTAVLLRATRLADWDDVAELSVPAVEVMAGLEHVSWAEEKASRGVVYGDRRSEGTHPDLVPWERLADDRREIDREFVRRRPEILARIGERVVDHPARAALGRLVHERYRAASGGRSWDESPEEDKAASYAFVDAIPGKLLMLGFRIADPAEAGALLVLDAAAVEELSRAEHDRWAAFRRSQGWEAGPERDDTARTHPHLVPWDELPEDVRELDRVLVRAIPSLLEVVGLTTRPVARPYL